jgi:hypothetical protein
VFLTKIILLRYWVGKVLVAEIFVLSTDDSYTEEAGIFDINFRKVQV